MQEPLLSGKLVLKTNLNIIHTTYHDMLELVYLKRNNYGSKRVVRSPL